jgi:carbon storage regulator
MLVLSRAKGDALVIGDDIVVEIVEITGDKVRLGIICPKEVPVHRREIWDAIQGGAPIVMTKPGADQL